MFESENVKTIRKIAIIDRVWEARHQVGVDVFLDDSPTSGRFNDHRNSPVRFSKKLSSKRHDAAFVISRCPG